MQINLLIISFVKMFFIMLTIIYSAVKIYNYKKCNIKLSFIFLLSSICISILYAVLKNLFGYMYAYFVCGGISLLICLSFMNVPLLKAIILILCSIALSFISLFISSIITFLLMRSAYLETTEQNVIEYIIIGVIQLTLIYSFFKIKRFNNG